MYRIYKLIFVILAVLTGIFFYTQADGEFQNDSDLYCNNMLGAGILNINVSDSVFGLRTYGVDGEEFSKEGGNKEGSILFLLFHAETVEKKDIQLLKIRHQQIGIQGWAAFFFGRICDQLTISGGTSYYLFRLMLAMMFAMVIVAISYSLFQSYNPVFAVVFYLGSVLSLWVINFSCSSYWVTFTLFLPMLVGLAWLKHKNRIVLFCFLMMLAVALKAGCGYEYMSTVMVSAIIFPIYSTIKMIGKETKIETKKNLTKVTALALACLSGFITVLLINGYLRENGDLFKGLHSIYYNDILRRTYGNAKDYDAATAPSLNAPLLTVLKLYLVSSKTGRTACLLLIVNFGLFIKNRRTRSIWADLILLLCAFAGALSWLILAKSHSYAHMHINHIVFYIGYMQIAVYLIIKGILSVIPIKIVQIQKVLAEK